MIKVKSNLCDHFSITTDFCPHCGWQRSTMREPGEIDLLMQMMKAAVEEKTKKKEGDPLRILVTYAIIIFVLDWVRGKMSNEDIIELIIK